VCADAIDRAVIVSVAGGDARVAYIDPGHAGCPGSVAVDLIPGVRVGDVVLVHMGVAIGRAGQSRGGAPRARGNRP